MAALIDESRVSSAVAQAASSERLSAGNVWLHTGDWLLMTVSPAMAPLFAQLHERNAEHFKPGMDVRPEMTQASFWAPVLKAQQQAHQEGQGLFLAGFLRGAPQLEIGCAISFSGIVHEEFESCWLGYRLDRSLEGRGLMQAAVAPAIDSVFQRFKLHRVMASHQPDNLRSGRLLRRLGFGIEGYARDFMKINGRWTDQVLLARLAHGA